MELTEVWVKGKGVVFDLLEEMERGPPMFVFKKENDTKGPAKNEISEFQLGLSF